MGIGRVVFERHVVRGCFVRDSFGLIPFPPSRPVVSFPTQLVIDHFGFFLQEGVIDEAAWEQLLALAE